METIFRNTENGKTNESYTSFSQLAGKIKIKKLK